MRSITALNIWWTKGSLTYLSARIKEKILFEIRDNGVGMSEETLKSILSGQVKSEKGSGVGLRNVHERIQLYFGMEYGVSVESELEEGTVVKITIPALLEDE